MTFWLTNDELMSGRSCFLSWLCILLLLPLAGWSNSPVVGPPKDSLQILADQHQKSAQYFLQQGRFDAAVFRLENARELLTRGYGPNAEELASVYHDLGKVEQGRGNFKSAITWYERAKGIFDLQPNRPFPVAPALLTQDLAAAWFELEDWERAGRLYEQALVLHQSYQSELVIPWYQAGCLAGLGRVAIKEGAHEEAERWLDSALKVMDPKVFPDHEVTAQIYLDQGKLFRIAGKNEAALTAYHKVLTGQVPGFSDSSVYVHPDLPLFAQDLLVMQALTGKAEVFAARYSHGLDALDKHAALVCFDLAMGQLKTLRRNSLHGDQRIQLWEASRGLFENAFRFCGEHLEQDPNLAGRAFEFAEQQHELKRWKSVQGIKWDKLRGIPENLIQEDADYFQTQIRLSREVRSLQATSSASPEKIRLLEDSLASVNQQYAAFRMSLREAHPQAMDWLWGREEDASPEDMLRSLPDARSILLEFVWGKDQVYLFGVSKQGVEMQVIPLEVEFVADLAKVLGMQHNPELGGDATSRCEGYATAALGVYQHLLAAMLTRFPDTERLLVVPDGPLQSLAFEALVTETPEASFVHFGKLNWLLKTCSVQYLASAGQWRELRKRSWSRAPEPLLAMAPGYPDSLRPAEAILSTLPKSEKSAERIALLTKGTSKLGSSATESELKEQGRQYRILHFAADAVYEDSLPLQSRIQLIPDGAEDGQLYAAECFQAHFDADLVVLPLGRDEKSGPGTGQGRQLLFEGFAYSGCRAVVLSLWKGEESVTVKLLEDFFTLLEEGMAKDKALQTAKLDYLRKADAEASDPYYWAAMVSQGDTVRVHQGRVYRQWALGGGGVVLILAAGFMISRRYRKKS